MNDIYREIKDEIQKFNDIKHQEILGKKQKIAFEQRIFNKLKEESGGKCAKCPRTENLTLDHIVPQTLLKDFGLDIEREIVPENYEILCRPCNVFKSFRLDFSNPKTKEILQFLLERI